MEGLCQKKPAIGSPGQIAIVIGVNDFNYAAWLLVLALLLLAF